MIEGRDVAAGSAQAMLAAKRLFPGADLPPGPMGTFSNMIPGWRPSLEGLKYAREQVLKIRLAEAWEQGFDAGADPNNKEPNPYGPLSGSGFLRRRDPG